MAAMQNKGDAQFRIGYLMLVEDAGSFDEGMHWMCCSHCTGLAKATNFLNLMIENAANEDAMYSLVHSSLEQVKRDTEINGLEYVPHKTKSSGGCYIATAVYGSYDAIEEETSPTLVASGAGGIAHPKYSTSKNSHHTIWGISFEQLRICGLSGCVRI